MAAAKKRLMVKMFGDGNFYIGEILYPFRNGEEVEARNKEHEVLLIAESERRGIVSGMIKASDEELKA